MDIKALFSKKEKTPVCSAVIVAAGSSQRMGTDKLMITLGADPVLVKSVRAFQYCPLVDEIIIVTRFDRIEEIAELCVKHGMSKVKQVISGGATRMESALAGVSAVKKGAELIAIHDGARPLVSQSVIENAIYAAQKYYSAVPAIKCVDTLKQVDENGIIVAAVDRNVTVRVQTPQVFNADMIKGALSKAVKDNLPLTDDCSAMEYMGIKTHVVEGEEDNIKITTPDDIIHAEAIIRKRGNLL